MGASIAVTGTPCPARVEASRSTKRSRRLCRIHKGEAQVWMPARCQGCRVWLQPHQSLRVGVIGAGSSGIAALKALLDRGLEAEAFERADSIGGNWVYGGRGSACYASLHANTSRERMQYADMPMPADMPAFPRHDRIRE